MRHLRLIIMSALISLIVSISAVEAEDAAYWEVDEPSIHWISIYGAVSGDVDLEEDDLVAAFDEDGNCYGCGVYDGSSYHLSAYAVEEADLDVPGDFTIEGFEDGEEVIFKVYRREGGEELTVEPSDGAYKYEYKGMHPPQKIDLMSDDAADDPADPIDPTDPADPANPDGPSTVNTPIQLYGEDEEEEEEGDGSFEPFSISDEEESLDVFPESPREEYPPERDDIYYENEYASVPAAGEAYTPPESAGQDVRRERIYKPARSRYLEENKGVRSRESEAIDTGKSRPGRGKKRLFFVWICLIALLLFIIGSILVAREYYSAKKSEKEKRSGQERG